MFSKAIHFEEKHSYGCFWKNNFCHLSFCFNLYTSHKTCEQAATSVHEKSTQNKQQQLACCPAKVIFPWLSDWVLVLSSVNWAFPPLSCITPALLSFPASQSWASSNASFIKKTLLVGCTPEFADWYCSITLIVIRASCCQPPTLKFTANSLHTSRQQPLEAIHLSSAWFIGRECHYQPGMSEIHKEIRVY